LNFFNYFYHCISLALLLHLMPIRTRSVNTFVSNIINKIIDNVVNRSSENEKNMQKIQEDVGGSVASVQDASASLELGCCSICCDDIQFDKGRFVLECGHTFHAKCILVEFRHRNRCPMCRTEVAESTAHKPSYIIPSSLRMYSSIIHDAADHFIRDLGNITFANVVHRMMLLSSEDQNIRTIQYPYIKRLLVQFASVLIRGVVFSVRDHEHETEDQIPIDIVDNMMEEDDGANESDYDAAISNPALDAAVAYQAIVTTDMNFDSPSHNDNVGSALIRRSVALAEMGVQRSELSLRRARRLALRRDQFQESVRLFQEAIQEREREQQEREQQEREQQQEGRGQNQNVQMVISEHEEVDEHSNPYGLEF
jgi:hypothetical protein